MQYTNDEKEIAGRELEEISKRVQMLHDKDTETVKKVIECSLLLRKEKTLDEPTMSEEEVNEIIERMNDIKKEMDEHKVYVNIFKARAEKLARIVQG